MDGFLLVNKEIGITSHDVVNIVRKKLGIRRVGHAGTLDPIAQGLMILGVGKATRLLEYLVGLDKIYSVEMILGQRSDSFDSEGNIEDNWEGKVSVKSIDKNTIIEVIKKYIGKISQIPPKFSALKINGKKAYELARAGEDIKMKSREITIYFIEKISIKDSIITFDVKCSSGTYIRSLVHDIGVDLGCGALMTGLMRTDIGVFNIKNSVNSNEINSEISLSSLDFALSSFERYDCSEQEKLDISQGKSIEYSAGNIDSDKIAIFYRDSVVAIGTINMKQGRINPKKVL